MATTTPEFVYDASTSEFQDEIWDVYRTLRDDLPLYYNSHRREYVLSRFEDVWRAVHDWETFSSVVAEAQSLLPQMIHTDRERHTQLRT
jgi:cytochrome P450